MWEFIGWGLKQMVGAIATAPVMMIMGVYQLYQEHQNKGKKGSTSNKSKDEPEYKVIGIVDPVLVTTPSTLAQTEFDTATYPDRALITLTNATAGTVTCNGISIRGKLVVQYADAWLWDYKDYARIERDGEMSEEIANKYIFDKDQVEDIGDFVSKELQAHSMYELHLNGCHYEYEIGDIWTLTLSYIINGQASEAEDINVAVEVTGVTIDRKVGEIGTTLLSVRVPSGTWSKTTSRRARFIAAGLPQFLVNRNNTIKVGASDFTEQANFYCDGSADDVQIQSAIDYVSDDLGGGIVLLSRGTFYIDNYITLKANVMLIGEGKRTVLKRENINYSKIINTNAENVSIIDLCCDGNSANLTYTSNSDKTLIHIENPATASIQRVLVRNISVSTTGYALLVGISVAAGAEAYLSDCVVEGLSQTCINPASASYIYGISGADAMTACRVRNITATAQAGGITGISAFMSCDRLQNCNAGTLTASGGTTNSGRGFANCMQLTNCLSDNSASNSVGYAFCKSTQQCKSAHNATHYLSSYADAGSLKSCADTADGGYNP